MIQKKIKKKFVINKSFVVFGIGRRDCAGQQLAVNEMIVAISNLVLNYHFEVDKNTKILVKTVAISKVDPPIGVKVTRRS